MIGMNDTERLIARLLARIDELDQLVQKQAAIIEFAITNET